MTGVQLGVGDYANKSYHGTKIFSQCAIRITVSRWQKNKSATKDRI